MEPFAQHAMYVTHVNIVVTVAFNMYAYFKKIMFVINDKGFCTGLDAFSF